MCSGLGGLVKILETYLTWIGSDLPLNKFLEDELDEKQIFLPIENNDQ